MSADCLSYAVGDHEQYHEQMHLATGRVSKHFVRSIVGLITAPRQNAQYPGWVPLSRDP